MSPRSRVLRATFPHAGELPAPAGSLPIVAEERQKSQGERPEAAPPTPALTASLRPTTLTVVENVETPE